MFSNQRRLRTNSNTNRINTVPPVNSAKKGRQTHSQSKHPSSCKNKPPTSTLSRSPPLKQSILAPIQQMHAPLQQRPYFLGKGNNHDLIRRILHRRKGWIQQPNSQFVWFKWTQTLANFRFQTMGRQCMVFNHFEHQKQLSNKQKLVQNLVNFCEANKINAYTFIPVTFVLDLTTGEQDLALHAFMKFYARNSPEQSHHNDHGKKITTITLPKCKRTPYLTAQHLNKRSQGNFYCKPQCPKSFIDPDSKCYLWILKPTFLNRGRGVALFSELEQLQKLIWKYYEGQGLEDFSQKAMEKYNLKNKMEDESEENWVQKYGQEFVKIQEPMYKQTLPKTIQVKQEAMQDQDQSKNKQSYSEQKHEMKLQPCQSEKKLLGSRPPLLQTQKSLKLKTEYSQKKQIEQNTSNYTSNSAQSQQKNSHKCCSFVIQKYIEKPLLIQGKKFDIRIWVLLTQNFEVYMFQEGYLRFSCHNYSTKDNNPFIHLTNNSVQKFCSEYNKESGNQIAFTEMIKYLPNEISENAFHSIKSRMQEIIWLSMCSVRRKINMNGRKECFELFGYDFMIDQEYRTWLIEINSNPSLDESGELLKMLMPRMVDGMFKLTLDEIFNNTMKEEIESFQVHGFKNDHNMWQCLGGLKEGANEKATGRRLTFARR